MKLITVLLAEDRTVVREGLRKTLELEDGLEVVGEAQDGLQAVALAAKLRPDVVLMDIAMPMSNGMEAARQILEAVPETKVLILSACSDNAHLSNATAVVAVGFLIKQTSSQDVCRAIREVQKGNAFFSSSVSNRFDHINPSKTAVQLTLRELEVLRLIAEGNANKVIAAELGISLKTVEKHREHLIQKLDIHDTAGLNIAGIFWNFAV
jgi:DNA-binding NarL/FixJ family response regulator